MKRPVTLIALTIIAALITACGNNKLDSLPREEALKVIDAQIKKDTDNAELYYQRAQILVALGKEKNLSQYFRDAINDLDVAAVTVGASKTLASISEANGKIVILTVNG